MTYVRPSMQGMWSSQDVLKIVPDRSRVRPGYLYAFLSSKYGVPLVVAGTYGAIIQHIEPEHVSAIEIPRLEDSIEKRIDEKISRAAKLRDKAQILLNQVSTEFDSIHPDLSSIGPRLGTTSTVLSSEVQGRLDAEFHNPLVVKIRKTLSSGDSISIGEWCDSVFLPGIFKRIHVPGPESAELYFTGYSLYWNEPEPKGYLSKITKLFRQVQLSEGMVLVQAFGQEGGLTGKPVWVGKFLAGKTTTHMLVRLVVKDLSRAAVLFGFLNSRIAYNQIACLTYGGSIPHFDEAGIRTVLMPRLDDERAQSISRRVLEAVGARDEALGLELEARREVEDTIAGAK
ncbi:type I restriction enzyme S subunit [Variovorax paradoxus]